MSKQRRANLAPQPSPLAPWTPLIPGRSRVLPDAERAAKVAAIARDTGRSEAEVSALLADVETDSHWLNSRYHVTVRKMAGPPPVIHLAIKRLDRAPVGAERYRDFMRIKDELLGEDAEAVELYPARDREVDSANSYHLWAFTSRGADQDGEPTERYRFPFGYANRLVIEKASAASGARQAAFEPHHVR